MINKIVKSYFLSRSHDDPQERNGLHKHKFLSVTDGAAQQLPRSAWWLLTA